MDGNSLCPLDILTRQRQALELAQQEVVNKRQTLAEKEAANLKQLISEFKTLRDILAKTETRVLSAVKAEYKQKAGELGTAERSIIDQLRQVKELKIVDSKSLANTIPDVSVDIQLSDFEFVADRIRDISVVKQSKTAAAELETKEQLRSVTKSGGFQFTPLTLAQIKPSTSVKRAADQLLRTAAKMKRQKILRAAAVDVDNNDEKLEIRSNVRDYIKCSKCNKPRCIYARKALIAEQKKEIREWKEKVGLNYECGDKLPALSSFSIDEVGIEDNVDCRSDVDIHYFFPPRNYPLVCYTCGSEDVAELSGEEKKNFSTFNPVCSRCADKGETPRTKRKIVRKDSVAPLIWNLNP